MKSVALYTRTSTSTQNTGLESQLRALESYCKDNNIKNYVIYEDNGISGTKTDRPALNNLKTDCKSGKISSVVVYSFSRMGRSTKHLIDTLQFFQDLKIDFISLTEKLDTTSAMGKCLFGIISSISQMEADLIKERVRNGLANAVAKGKKLGSPNKVDKKLIASLLLEPNMSYSKIAKLANCSKATVCRVHKNQEQNLGNHQGNNLGNHCISQTL
jgi:putative DNA-invertase from lambdoid prophage Rac